MPSGVRSMSMRAPLRSCQLSRGGGRHQSCRKGGGTEGADDSGVRVGDGHDAVGLAVPFQRPAGALDGQGWLAGLRNGVDQAHAVRGGEHHPFPVDLKALVQGGDPGGAEAHPTAVRGQVGALEDQGEVGGEREVGLRHQHGAGRHVDRLSDARSALALPGRRTEFDQVGAERRRPQHQRHLGLGEQAPLDAGLRDTTGGAERPAVDHAVLCRGIDLVEAESLLHAGGDLQGLGDREVDGHRLHASEGRRDQRAGGDFGDGGGDGDAHGGAEFDEGLGGQGGSTRGSTRGHEGQRDATHDDRGIDADLRPEFVDGVVDGLGELVQCLGHLAGRLGEVAEPARVVALGVPPPEGPERLYRLTRVVGDQGRGRVVDGRTYIVDGVGEGPPGIGGVPQGAGIGIRPPQAQLEQEVLGLVLNAHLSPLSWPSPSFDSTFVNIPAISSSLSTCPSAMSVIAS